MISQFIYRYDVTNETSIIECMITSIFRRFHDVERTLLDLGAFQRDVSPVGSTAFILSQNQVSLIMNCSNQKVHMFSS